MTLNPALYASDKMDWGTPQEFFDLLDTEFNFTLDACATAANAKCTEYLAVDHDGLTTPWGISVVWCNPPYGREIGGWVAKCLLSAEWGATVVLLIPARTDTAYWHDYVMRAAEIRFVRGRLRFAGAAGAAPFPSAVIVFRPGHNGAPVVRSMGRNAQEAATRVPGPTAPATLADVQEGDLVMRWHYYDPADHHRLAAVTRTTKAQIHIGEDRFSRKDGRLIGGFFTSDSIRAVTKTEATR